MKIAIAFELINLPDRIAGMSVTFGGVNSTKAYFAATCNFGRDATIKSARKILKKITFCIN